MTQDKNQFYFEGKYFDTQEEFWVYVQQWGQLPLEPESAKIHANRLVRDIILNIFLRNLQFTNTQFIRYLQEIFEFSIKKLDALPEKEGEEKE